MGIEEVRWCSSQYRGRWGSSGLRVAQVVHPGGSAESWGHCLKSRSRATSPEWPRRSHACLLGILTPHCQVPGWQGCPLLKRLFPTANVY